MGSGGTEFETADNFDPIRLNQKTRFVGKAIQATNLITDPQVGQCVFPTSTDGTFTSNKTHFRNSADTAWIDNEFSVTDYSNTHDVTTLNSVDESLDDRRSYSFLTLPSTYRFYIITDLEIDVASATGASGSYVFGADLVDSETPTSTHTPLICIAPSYSIGAGIPRTTIKRKVSSKPLPAGAVLGLWINADFTGSSNFIQFGASTALSTVYNRVETINSSPPTAFNAVWNTSSAFKPGIKVYAKGYL